MVYVLYINMWHLTNYFSYWLFAATTPIEAITGIPGLYIWNSVACKLNCFNLIEPLTIIHTYYVLNSTEQSWSNSNLGYPVSSEITKKYPVCRR